MDTGHGMGTPLSTRVEESADIYAFLMEQLRMEAR
jgi:prolyl oligopeptidase PreP (S9A serine peptidase family)